MTDRIYAAKTWMNEPFRLMTSELRIRREHAEKLKPDDGALDYSKDRVQSDGSNYEEKLLSYSMACDEVNKLELKIIHLKRIRFLAINRLTDSQLRTILLDRYLNFKEIQSGKGKGRIIRQSFNDIAEHIHFSARHTERLHDEALNQIYDIIPEVDDEN